ncbi:hypothetical protein [Phenylobacterium sp.]|uniref:hypothetical protein n=1 Tax=Phenylobacterium sp. TaxID=1871053 RepID=UPI0027346827|nr:hypothetical protein [Phenylobacterium sp.]MDP3853617.1 hypothetical protein [Phenylobacterium sp.]
MTLLFDINTLCMLEDKLNISAGEIAELAGPGMRLGFLRTLLWAGLHEHHGDLDLKAVGLLIHGAGVEVTAAKVIEALVKAFPASEAGKATPGPRKAARTAAVAGTGQSSLSSGVG